MILAVFMLFFPIISAKLAKRRMKKMEKNTQESV